MGIHLFEKYCCVYSRVDIGILADSLDMNRIVFDRWVLTVISTIKLSVKIDFQLGHVIRDTQQNTIIEHILEKIDILTTKTNNLGDKVVGLIKANKTLNNGK